MADKINNKKMNDILKSASGKLGTDPDSLKDAIHNGKVDDITKNMKPGDAQKLQKILSNKDETKKLLSTPQAQQLLKKLFEGK